jgi:thiamine-monophosphate kinase
LELPLEFQRIARHFAPLAGAAGLGLADDAAVLTTIPGALVLSADAMVEGVHFPVGEAPDRVARKLLRTNLSDLAAMGANPLGYLLTLAVPRTTPEAWFEGFAAGLAVDQAVFGLKLLGGDSTSTPGPVTVSLTILGTAHAVLRRSGARAGDDIWVSGTIGDAALGLLALRGEVADADGFLVDRYRLPQPRLELGRRLVGIAHAGMDISDGLVQDLGHLCRAAGLGAVVEASLVPASAAARAAGSEHLAQRLTGGDDYELLFAAAPGAASAVATAASASGTPVMRIGHFRDLPAHVTVLDDEGGDIALARGGWSHFDAAQS